MQKSLVNDQPSTKQLKLIASITQTDISPCASIFPLQQQKQKNALSVNTKQSSLSDVLMSHTYNLRSRNSSPSEKTPSNKSNTDSSSSLRPPDRTNPLASNSPYFTGFTPYFIPSYVMAEDQVNAVSGSQNELNAIDAENQDGQNLLEGDEHLDRSHEEVLKTVDSIFKRNQTNSFLRRLKDDINGIKEALVDQVAASIIDEDFQDIVDMVKTYNRVVGPVLDLPEDPQRDQGINDFIDVHRDEHNSLNEDMNSLKLKVKRLVTMDAMRVGATTQTTSTRSSNPHSALKLPRIQIPRFEDNNTGTLDWENFKHMMSKLTADMSPEEKIFVLKSALSGESAKLVANEQDHAQAMNMLYSVYGNELLQSQSKIQEFISLVHEEATEKNHTTSNRNLWQRFKMFSNFLDQQLQNQSPSSVLHSLACALVIGRVPYQMKQIIIRTRRELEAQAGSSLTLDELLGLYNNLIHDLEISHGAQKDKAKPKKPEKNVGEPTKPKRRSLLSKKDKDKPKKKCILCSSETHNVRSHHFDKHGFYPIKKIREVVDQNNLCLKCCLPVEVGSPCEQAQCSNITRNCYTCNSKEHYNILCDKSRQPAASPGGIPTPSPFAGGAEL